MNKQIIKHAIRLKHLTLKHEAIASGVRKLLN